MSIAILVTASIMYQGGVVPPNTELTVSDALAQDLIARGRAKKLAHQAAAPASDAPLRLAETPTAPITVADDTSDSDQNSSDGDGDEVDLNALDIAQLRALCTEHGIAYANNAGADTLRKKLLEAFGGAA